MDDTALALDEVNIRGYSRSLSLIDMGFPIGVLPRESVEVSGWIVGVRSGSYWGWWGSVDHDTALASARLFHTMNDKSPTSIQVWGKRFRLATRHSHAGALALSVGALELACWDLKGAISDLPVWAMITATKDLRTVQTYASCLGLEGDTDQALETASILSKYWDIQKWRGDVASADKVDSYAEASGGDFHLALDFHGRTDPSLVRELCGQMKAKLAWVEEPYHPSRIHDALPREFGVAHAAGEHCYGPHELAIFRSAGVDILQPDSVFCGGFANFLEIAEAAAEVHMAVAPHGGGFIPAVHASIAGAPIWKVEYHLLIEQRRQAYLASPVLPVINESGNVEVPYPTGTGWGGPLHRSVQ